jgi:hypothetical protein
MATSVAFFFFGILLAQKKVGVPADLVSRINLRKEMRGLEEPSPSD